VVLSRDEAIAARRVAVVAPCTTRFRALPSQVELDPAIDPVTRSCVVTLDALESVGVGVFIERLGKLSDQRMREVCSALAVAVDC
jgi:mRNA interferase MazF